MTAESSGAFGGIAGAVPGNRHGKAFALALAVTNLEIVDTLMEPAPLDERLLRIEAALIAEALAETRGNKSEAARRLGIKRSTLGDRITRCGLRRSELPQPQTEIVTAR